MQRFLSLIPIFICALWTGEVSAQTSFWAESFNKINNGRVSTQLNFSLAHHLKGPHGLMFWSLVNEDYSESILGYTFNPRDNLQFAVGTGLETNPNPWRIYGHLWMGGPKHSLFAVLETGGSGYWYLGEGFWNLNEELSLGFRSQRFVGTGPLLRGTLLKRPRITLWVVPIAWDFEFDARNTAVALRVGF